MNVCHYLYNQRHRKITKSNVVQKCILTPLGTCKKLKTHNNLDMKHSQSLAFYETYLYLPTCINMSDGFYNKKHRCHKYNLFTIIVHMVRFIDNSEVTKYTAILIMKTYYFVWPERIYLFGMPGYNMIF